MTLSELADQWEKDAAAYIKQAGIKDGSKVADLTSVQIGHSYSASTYRACAKQLRNIINTMKKSENDKWDTQIAADSEAGKLDHLAPAEEVACVPAVKVGIRPGETCNRGGCKGEMFRFGDLGSACPSCGEGVASDAEEYASSPAEPVKVLGGERFTCLLAQELISDAVDVHRYDRAGCIKLSDAIMRKAPQIEREYAAHLAKIQRLEEQLVLAKSLIRQSGMEIGAAARAALA